jgi:site-specific DNA-methyltransferase (adenine-specific)
MPELGGESIHLVVTSPPYWRIKDYGVPGQIGYNDTYEEYVAKLDEVWRECYRVLHKGCRLCVNIGDQFTRATTYGRYKVIAIREEIIRSCEEIGFDYMGAIIWQKMTTCNTTGGASVMGSFPYPRNGMVYIDYEFILLFKKLGRAPTVPLGAKEASKLSMEEWSQYFVSHWDFPGVRQEGHLAMFPDELPRRLIKMFSFVGDTVLDPFLGSGTTTKAAAELRRNSIGYEINPAFLPTIQAKLGIGARQQSLPLETDAAHLEIVERGGPVKADAPRETPSDGGSREETGAPARDAPRGVPKARKRGRPVSTRGFLIAESPGSAYRSRQARRRQA